MLVDFFLTRYCQRHQRNISGFSEQTLQLLNQYTWPGNVRELENTVERAVVLCKDSVIMPHDLPHSFQSQKSSPNQDALQIPIGTPLQEVERRLIQRTLDFTQGDKRKAAQLLGIATRTIYRKLEA